MNLFLLIVGLFLLIFGAELIIRGSISLGRKLKVSLFAIGVVIVAGGTSLPELAVSLEAVAGNRPDLAVGGVMGSNVANVMLVLGTASMLGAASDPGIGVRRDAKAMMFASMMLLGAVYLGDISRTFGGLMLICLVGYYAYSYLNTKEEESEIEDSWVPDNIMTAALVTAIGGVLIWKGADLLIEGATGIASSMGISEAIIGLSVVALGTSLPELAVTIVAGLRGQGGVAVGNVLGSNMMNILGILGVTALIGGGISVNPGFAERDIWVMLLTSGLVAAMLLDDREIGRRTGFSMVAGYILYMAYLYL